MPGDPAPDSEPPLVPAELEPATFAGLAGFAEEDHAEAFRVFRRSCAAIVAQQPPLRAGKPPSAALLAVCRRALDAGDLDGPAARGFFEARFRPRRIVPWSRSAAADPAESETNAALSLHRNFTTRSGIHDTGNCSSGPERAFLTGYYEPIVAGALTRTEAFSTPILAWPRDTSRPGMRAASAGRASLPDRAAIEALAREGHFEPIVWLRDPVEVFFVQVQGSAHVRLADGTMLRLVYAGRNGHPYTSIGRILVECGAIAGADMSRARLEAWIREHGQAPGEAGALLMQRNASYVFFRAERGLDPDDGPIGGQGIGLTRLRSIAIDRTIYAYGLPFFVSARLPWRGREATPFRRLMIAQDTGSAIRGPVRADIFFGSGDDAGARAGDIRHAGDLVVLWPEEEGPVL